MVNLQKIKAQNSAFQIIPKDIFTQSARIFPKLMLKIINNNENEKMLTYIVGMLITKIASSYYTSCYSVGFSNLGPRVILFHFTYIYQSNTAHCILLHINDPVYFKKV